MQLTDKQKELFQLDKYILVDTIIILENKLQSLRNEMLLNSEAAKAKRAEKQAAAEAEAVTSDMPF